MHDVGTVLRTIDSPTSWNLAGPECEGRTLDCYFEPLSNCRIEDVVTADTPNVYLTPDGYLHPKVQVQFKKSVISPIASSTYCLPHDVTGRANYFREATNS